MKRDSDDNTSKKPILYPHWNEQQIPQSVHVQSTHRNSQSSCTNGLLITTAAIGSSMMLAAGFAMISLGAIVLVASSGTLVVPFLALVEKGILLCAASLGINVGAMLVGCFTAGAVLLGGSMFALNRKHEADKEGLNDTPMVSAAF